MKERDYEYLNNQQIKLEKERDECSKRAERQPKKLKNKLQDKSLASKSTESRVVELKINDYCENFEQLNVSNVKDVL